MEEIIEGDCLSNLGIIFSYVILDLAMLRWCIYIRFVNPEVGHISGIINAIVDMLSRARYKEEEIPNSDDEPYHRRRGCAYS